MFAEKISGRWYAYAYVFAMTNERKDTHMLSNPAKFL